MNVYPTQLERQADDRLLIVWSDGGRRSYTTRQIRDACPCATCREKRSAPPEPAGMLPILSTQETLPPSIASMKPVGTYAYSIEFSDGHDTGIFTYELLRRLGEETE